MFGEKLKELRTGHKYSMDTLAELYNTRFDGKMNKSTISRYENGLQEPMYTVVKNLAELFEVSIDYLLSGLDEEKKLTPKDELSESAQIAIEYVKKIKDEKELDRVIRILSVLVGDDE